MRLQAHLTAENTVAINQLLDTVNEARKRGGMEPTTLTHLTNEIIARAVERSTINLCNVFVSPGQPAVQLKAMPRVPEEATPESIEILASVRPPHGVAFQLDADQCRLAAAIWNACRGAMTQGGTDE